MDHDNESFQFKTKIKLKFLKTLLRYLKLVVIDSSDVKREMEEWLEEFQNKDVIKVHYFNGMISLDNKKKKSILFLIFKHGLEKCLNSLDFELTALIKNIISKNKYIIGGATSSS